MPSALSLPRPALLVAALSLLALPGANAHASTPRADLPCVAGVTCPQPTGSTCADTDLVPTGTNLARVERATLCLINRQRVAHHLPRLRPNRVLHSVARHYAHRMVVRSFFDHTSPGGGTFDQRIRHSGYLSGARGYIVGENLAWGGGPLATPRAIVRAWMHSPEHRANILNSQFRDAGLGVSPGIPVGGAAGATYANEFGKRL